MTEDTKTLYQRLEEARAKRLKYEAEAKATKGKSKTKDEVQEHIETANKLRNISAMTSPIGNISTPVDNVAKKFKKDFPSQAAASAAESLVSGTAKVGNTFTPVEGEVSKAAKKEYEDIAPEVDGFWDRAKKAMMDSLGRGKDGNPTMPQDYFSDYLERRDKKIDASYKEHVLRSTFAALDGVPRDNEGRYIINGVAFTRDELMPSMQREVTAALHPQLMATSGEYRNDYAKSLGFRDFNTYIDETIINPLKALDAEIASEAVEKANDSTSAFPEANMAIRMGVMADAETKGRKDIRDAIDAMESLKRGDWSAAFAEGFDFLNFATLGVSSLGSDINQLRMLNKVKNGEELTSEEQRMYDIYKITQNANALREIVPQTFWQDIWRGIGTTAQLSSQFMPVMGIASSVANLGKVGVKTGIGLTQRALRQGVIKGVMTGIKQTGRVAGKLGLNVLKANWAGLVVSPLQMGTYSTFLQKREEQFKVVDGKLVYTPTKAWKDVVDTLIEQTNEISSEVLGAGIADVVGVSFKSLGKMIGLDKVINGVSSKLGLGASYNKIFGLKKGDAFKAFERRMSYTGDPVSEGLSEIWGDISTNLMKMCITGTEDFSMLRDPKYWATNLAVAGIYGTTLNMAHSAASLPTYTEIAHLGKAKHQALRNISSKELKDALRIMGVDETINEAAFRLAQLNWSGFSPTDRANAMDFLRAESQQQILIGVNEENNYMARFTPVAASIQQHAYRGKEGEADTGLLYEGTLEDGTKASIVSGDMTTESNADNLLMVMGKDGNITPMARSKFKEFSAYRMGDIITAEYQRMYGTESIKNELAETEETFEALEQPTPKEAMEYMRKLNIPIPEEGEKVKLVDGREGMFLGWNADGSLNVEAQKAEGPYELLVMPFHKILSAQGNIAQVQQEMLAGKALSAAEEAIETETPEAEVIPEAETPEEAQVETATAIEEAQNEVADISAVPMSDDGNVDFEAITDPALYAKMYVRELGSTEVAIDDVSKMRSMAEQSILKLEEKRETLATANERIANRKEVEAMKARIAFYDAVLDTLSPKETMAEPVADTPEVEAPAVETPVAEVETPTMETPTFYEGDIVEHNGRKAEVVENRGDGTYIIDYKMADNVSNQDIDIVDGTSLTKAQDEVEAAENTVGIVDNAESRKIADDVYNTVNSIAKSLGIVVEFVPIVVNSAGQAVNGLIDGKKVLISSQFATECVNWLTGHEFLHYMKEVAPEQYAKYVESVKSYLGEEEWNKRMEKQKALYLNHKMTEKANDETLMTEECVADFTGEMVEKNDAFNNYLNTVKEEKGLLAAIKRVLRAIGKLFTGKHKKRVNDMLKQVNALIAAAEKANTEGVKPQGNNERNSLIKEQSAPIFYSNAQYAVQNIKQEKATPEQWLKMIEKNGSLKAGEDKWLGLSDWLKDSDKKTLTKDEVLQYIAENDIQIEEVEYGDIEDNPRFKELEKEYQSHYSETYDTIISFERMAEKYGEDFELAFEASGMNLYPRNEYGSEDAQRYLGVNEINSTRRQYTTDGLTNKREIALTVPTIESWNTSDNIHFGDAGEGRAVAWIRFGEATDADGKRVLVIDEIQSKRHQDGREKGYRDVEAEKREKAERERELTEVVLPRLAELNQLYNEKYGVGKWRDTEYDRQWRPRRVYRLLTPEEQAEHEAIAQRATELQMPMPRRDGVPSAPFEKNWAELAFKRMLRYAAENDYDYVAWTTGDQQADRYDIGSVVKDIVAYDTKDADGNPIKKMKFRMNNMGTYNIATNMEGVIVKGDGEMKEGMRLSDITGKPLAEKIMNGEGEDAMVFENGKDIEAKSLEGEELHIGNEGMKGFYDQMLPSFVKKYTKKWGAEVGEVTMPDLEENNTMHAVNVTDSMRESVMQGQPKFSLPSLVGVHNLSLDKLRKVIKMGGLANPSVAVIDVDKQTHVDYGEYSLILPKNMVDARQGKNAGTWAGDAWTPTYPQVVKRMNDDKAISRFYKDIDALPEAMRSRVRLDFDSFMDGRSANALAYWYLVEKGNAPEMVLVPSRYSNDVTNAVSEATKGSFSMFNLTPEERAKCLDAYIAVKFDGDRAAFEAEMQARIERLAETIETKKSDRVKKWAQDTIDSIKEYGFDYDDVATFIRDVEYDAREKGKVNVDATILAAQERINESNLAAEYDAWRNNLDERYGIEEYIFDGYTNSGNRRYLPHTVENASKWMKKQGREGAVATFPSFGTFVAVSIPKMTTLESIRKRKALLGKSKEEYDAFREKWENVYYELGKKLQPDAKSFEDYGYWRLIEAVGQKNPKEFIKKQYGVELSEEDMAQLNEMLDAIRTEYPARYFETKFERPLQLSDFVAAVVPNDIPLDVESRLRDANVEIFEYEKGDSNSRAEAMQKASAVENVRFSLQTFDAVTNYITFEARAFGITTPIFVVENAEEFKQALREIGVRNVDDYEDVDGIYDPDNDAIYIRADISEYERVFFEVLLHENTHAVTRSILPNLKAVLSTLNEEEILAYRDSEMSSIYKKDSALSVLNEIISYFVEEIPQDKLIDYYQGEIDIEDNILSDFKISLIENELKRKFISALRPVILANLEIQKRNYNERKGKAIVIARGYMGPYGAKDEKSKSGSVNTEHEGGYDARGEGKAQGGVLQKVGAQEDQSVAPTRYSLPDMPFFEDNGDVVSFEAMTPEERKMAKYEDAQRMTSEGADAQAILDATGWLETEDGWEYFGEADIDLTGDRDEMLRVGRWLQSKRAVKKNGIRKMYAELIKEQRDVINDIKKREAEASASRGTIKAQVEAFLQGQAPESLSIEDQVLVDIARGQRLKWKDGNGKRGLSTELGLTNARAEKMGAVTIGAIDYLEDYVAALMERNNGYDNDINDNDIRNAVIEMFRAYPSPKRALDELYGRYATSTAVSEAEEGLYHLEVERDNALAEIDAEHNATMANFEANPTPFIREYNESASWQAEIDLYTNSLRKAKSVIDRMTTGRATESANRKSKAEAVRLLKTFINNMLRGDLARYTHKRDIVALMNAVNESTTIYQMQRAVNKAMESAYNIRLRKEVARMNNLTKMRIVLNETNLDPQIFLNNMVRDGKMTAGAARAILNNYWRGVNASGVAIAKGVDGDTSEIMAFIHENIDLAKLGEKTVAEKCKDLRDAVEGDRTLDEDLKAKKIASVDIIEEYLTLQQMINALREINGSEKPIEQTVAQQATEIAKLNNELRALEMQKEAITRTDRGYKSRKTAIKKKLAELRNAYNTARMAQEQAYASYYGSMPDIIERLYQANTSVEKLLKDGIVELSRQKQAEVDHRNELIRMALEDINRPEALVSDKVDYTLAQKAHDSVAGRFVTSQLNSLDHMLRRAGENAPNGEGRLWKYFVPKLLDAYNRLFDEQQACADIMNKKCKQLFGKDYNKTMMKAESVVIGTRDEVVSGKVKTTDITIAQALNIIATWDQADGRASLEKQGITEDKIQELIEKLYANNPKWMAFEQWVVHTFLPSRREKYNKVHRSMFGVNMNKEINYFPIRRKKDDLYQNVDLTEANFDVLPSTITGSIIQRTKSTAKIDLDNSFFEVLRDHIVDMEKWAEMAPITKDFNTMLSSKAVQAVMNAKGKHFLGQFKEAAKIATLNFTGNSPEYEKIFMPIVNRMWASSLLAFKPYTALKQLASSVMFAQYSADPCFVGRLLYYYVGGLAPLPDSVFLRIGKGEVEPQPQKNALWNIQWAKKNSAMFRERWQSVAAGDEAFTRQIKYDTKLGKFVGEGIKDFTTLGMRMIAFVDAYTSAAGMRAVYDVTYRNLKEKGASHEEAHKEAMFRAEMAVNKTQQSSQFLYLSPIQMSRGFVSIFATFKNAPFAQGRLIAESWAELIRNPQEERRVVVNEEAEWLKTHQYARAYAEIEEQIAAEKANGTLSAEDENKRREELQRVLNASVRAIAEKKAPKIMRGHKVRAALALTINAYIAQFAFNAMAVLPYVFFGDDDEKKKQLLKDVALWSLAGPLSTIPLGNDVISLFQGFKFQPLGAVGDFVNDINKIVKAAQENGFDADVALMTADFLARKAVGVDYKTYFNLYAGLDSLVEDGYSHEALLKMLNAPNSQVRLLAGERREGETAQQYATRILRLYAILDDNIYEDNYVDGEYTGDNRPVMMSKTQMRNLMPDYEREYRSDVLRRKAGYIKRAEIDAIDEEYAKVMEAMGWTANRRPNKKAFESGKYEAPVSGVRIEEYRKLASLATRVANAYDKTSRYIGDDEDKYYDYILAEMERKQQMISEFNKAINTK